MDLKHYAAVMWHRIGLVLLVAATTTAVVIFGSHSLPRSFTATTLVRLVQAQPDGVSSTSLSYTERIMNTYVRLLTSRPIVARALSALSLDESPEDLIDRVTVEVLPETELLEISVEHPDPDVAAAIANSLAAILVAEGESVFHGAGGEYAAALAAEIAALETELAADRSTLSLLLHQIGPDGTPEPAQQITIERLQMHIRGNENAYASLRERASQAQLRDRVLAQTIHVVDPAVAPGEPDQPGLLISAILGAFTGLVAGIGLALVVDSLDSRIRSVRQLAETTALDVVSSIPAVRVPRRERKHVVRVNHGSSQDAWEAFRTLGAIVLAELREREAKSLLIASACARDGRSTVALNLAISLAGAGWGVILVDSDLRSPRLHQVLRTSNSCGLSDLAIGLCTLDEALQETAIAGLRVITSGTPTPRPDRIVGPVHMRGLLEDLEKRADVVLLDSPPILDYADALALAMAVDSALLIVADEQAEEGIVAEAARRLMRVCQTCAGIVVNRARHSGVMDTHPPGTEHLAAYQRAWLDREVTPMASSARRWRQLDDADA